MAEAVGESVEAFEPLVEISTDKVETEIPSPAAGMLLAIYIEEGETVAKGTLLGIDRRGGGTAPHPCQQPERRAMPLKRQRRDEPHRRRDNRAITTTTIQGNGVGWHVTPVVARMAAEHGIDVAAMRGSGHGGRVTKKDVEAYLATIAP